MRRRSRETQESTPPIILEVGTTLEEIPDPPNCPGCSDLMIKTFFVYRFNNHLTFQVPQMAGYACRDCGEERGSMEALHEAHLFALTHLQASVNKTPELSRRISRYEKNIAVQKRLLDEAAAKRLAVHAAPVAAGEVR